MNKNKLKLYFITFITLILIIVPFSSYINYKLIKIEIVGQNEFYNKLIEKAEQKKSLEMGKITSFDWDLMYVFPPYTSKKYMEDEIGIKWTTQATYFRYLYERKIAMKYLDGFDELGQTLVFINDNHIELVVRVDLRELDFRALNQREFLVSEANFIIEETNNRSIIQKQD